MSEEIDIDMSWDANKELSLMISCVKNALWNKNQQSFENKCLIRELLQKCSGGKIVEMLKNILSGEEKGALVRNELNSFFLTQGQSFENYISIKSETIPPLKKIKTEHVDESDNTTNSSVPERAVEVSNSALDNHQNQDETGKQETLQPESFKTHMKIGCDVIPPRKKIKTEKLDKCEIKKAPNVIARTSYSLLDNHQAQQNVFLAPRPNPWNEVFPKYKDKSVSTCF